MRMNRKMIRNATLVSVLFVTTALLTGCPFVKDDGAVQAVPSSSASGQAGFEATLYPFVRTNCIQCHGTIQIPLFANANPATAYSLAYSLVNFAQIPASKFVSKIKDGHCGLACNTDGSNMVNMITTWKAAYGSKANLPGSPVDTGNYFTTGITIPSNPPSCVPDGTNSSTNLQGTPDPGGGTSVDVNGNTISVGQSSCWMKLRYPLSQVTPALPAKMTRGWFEVDVAYENLSTVLGIASYTFKNPRIVSPDSAVYVHDIKTFVNGNYHPEYGAVYQNIDVVVGQAVAAFLPPPCASIASYPFPTPYPITSTCVPSVADLASPTDSATGVLSEGTGDKLSFSFEYLQPGITTPCADLNMFTTKVFEPIKVTALLCLNCHKAAGDVTLAGQRFNMDPNDANSNPNGMADVCEKFLQRSTFSAPDNSSIIVQPEKGTNGMPAQLNFTGYYAPTWICWINRENCLLNSGNPAACPTTCN